MKIITAGCSLYLRQPGYVHDRRAEKVLQRDEETRIEKATEANSKTSGKMMIFNIFVTKISEFSF